MKGGEKLFDKIIAIITALTALTFPNSATASETDYKEPEQQIIVMQEDKEVVQPSARELFKKYFPEEDYDETVDVLSKVLRREAGVVKSTTNRACVIWCILNRCDKGWRGNTPIECATARAQFCYRKNTKYSKKISDLVEDVLYRWLREKEGEIDVGRVLPRDIIYFSGNGEINVFRYDYDINSKKYKKSVHSDVYGD